MPTHNLFFAGGGVLTAFVSIMPLWLIFQGDLLGAAIIGIPSALALVICLGVGWTLLEE